MSEVCSEQKQPLQIPYREACEECHKRKVRCIAQNGPCNNCVSNGKDCVYRQRGAMGRPRKQKSDNQQPTRAKMAASRKLRAKNAKPATRMHDNAGSASVESQQAGLISPEHRNHQESNAVVQPHIMTSAEPSSHSLSEIASNYSFNLPDLEFDDYFESNAGNVASDTITGTSAFDGLFEFQNNDNSLYTIIATCSTILFQVRRLCDRLSVGGTEMAPADLSDVFKHVSDFCGVILPRINSIGLDTHQWEETQTITQLVTMVMSTAISCYSMLLERQKDLTACALHSQSLSALGVSGEQLCWDEITGVPSITHGSTPTTLPGSSCPELYNSSTSSHSSVAASSLSPVASMLENSTMVWPASSSTVPSCGQFSIPIIPDLSQLKRRLATIIHFTVMDYHTAQFQWILANLVEALGQSSFAVYHEFPLDELAGLQKEANELRGRIQSSSQKVRESYFT